MDAVQLGRKYGSQILAHLTRHLAALTWLDGLVTPRRVEGPTEERIDLRLHLASGFLLAAGRYVFWITAGHVLTDLRRVDEVGRKVIKSRLMVGWHESPQGLSIPFPLELHPQIFFDHAEFGFDFGAILLRHHTVALLSTSGVEPLTRRVWASPTESFDAYFLLGFPDAGRDLRIQRRDKGGDAHFGAGTPLIPLERIDNPPECLKSKHPRFFGRILEMPHNPKDHSDRLSDIGGMSGGPIIGVRRTRTRLSYKLVAAQGSWASDSKVVAGSFVRPLAQFVVKQIDEMHRSKKAG